MDAPTPHSAVTLTDANFTAEVKTFNGIVLVDFWAEWCGPCKIMGPEIEKLAQKYAGNPLIKVGKLDVDANQETAMEYRILSLPTFKIFRNGQVIDEMIGAVGSQELDKMLTRLLPQFSPMATAANSDPAAASQPAPAAEMPKAA